MQVHFLSLFFFFNDTATTEIYTLSLHDALPIYSISELQARSIILTYANLAPEGREEYSSKEAIASLRSAYSSQPRERSEEHTSELQSRSDLVCRLLLEKKKIKELLHHKLL